MYLKLIGAVLVLAGCGGCGIRIGILHRREVDALHRLVQALDGIQAQLQYHLTPLPELCRLGGEYSQGCVRNFFYCLADNLDALEYSDVGSCVQIALKRTKDLPLQTVTELEELGRSLGQFDLQGQLSALAYCKNSCLKRLERLEHQQDNRLRSYQTLGFCAGAALAILLL